MFESLSALLFSKASSQGDLHASAFSWAMPKTQLLEDDWLTSPV